MPDIVEIKNVLIGLPHFCVISIPTGRERNLVLIKLYCYVLYLWVFLRIVTEPDKHVKIKSYEFLRY